MRWHQVAAEERADIERKKREGDQAWRRHGFLIIPERRGGLRVSREGQASAATATFEQRLANGRDAIYGRKEDPAVKARAEAIKASLRKPRKA